MSTINFRSRKPVNKDNLITSPTQHKRRKIDKSIDTLATIQPKKAPIIDDITVVEKEIDTINKQRKQQQSTNTTTINTTETTNQNTLSNNNDKTQLQSTQQQQQTPTQQSEDELLQQILIKHPARSPIRTRRQIALSDSNNDEWKQQAEKLLINHAPRKHRRITSKASDSDNTVTSTSTSITPFYVSLLPSYYQALISHFNALETVMCITRSKSIQHYRKIYQSVQAVSNKNFAKSHLAQICSVYPESYSIDTTHYIDDYGSTQRDILIHRLDTHSNQQGESNHVSTAVLNARKKQFEINLYKIVEQYHNEFLHKHNIVHDNDSDNLLYGITTGKWHNLFELEAIPHIKPVDIPGQNNRNTQKSIQSLLELNTRREPIPGKPGQRQTITNNDDNDSNNTTSNNTSSLMTENIKYTDKDLVGLDTSIFKLAEQKQQQLQSDNGGLTTEQNVLYDQYNRLPRVYSLIRNILQTAKRMTYRLTDLIDTMYKSNKEFNNKKQALSDIKLLIQCVPEYATIQSIGSVSDIRQILTTKQVKADYVLTKLKQAKEQWLSSLNSSNNGSSTDTTSNNNTPSTTISNTSTTTIDKPTTRALSFDNISVEPISPTKSAVPQPKPTEATKQQPTVHKQTTLLEFKKPVTPAKRSLGLGLSSLTNNNNNNNTSSSSNNNSEIARPTTPVVKKGLSSFR